jgi:hypothetical protein
MIEALHDVRDLLQMLLVLLIWLILASGLALWAKQRGQNVAAMFFISFLLSPLIGLIAVAASSDFLVRCPFCAERIRAEARRCSHCCAELPVPNSAST